MKQNQLRIIGGKWRGRKLKFPDVEGLRPTPDRVRETLFNWLAPVIQQTICLDLFAGSGALGFEALSRGAQKVVFVDTSYKVIQQLKTNQNLLNCDAAAIIKSNADAFLARQTEKFDIIFLDPPFHQGLIEKTCKEIFQYGALKPDGYIYIEREASLKEIALPTNFNILKERKAGQITYALIQYCSN